MINPLVFVMEAAGPYYSIEFNNNNNILRISNNGLSSSFGKLTVIVKGDNNNDESFRISSISCIYIINNIYYNI